MSLDCTSNIADASMVSPPMTVWAVAGRAKKARVLARDQMIRVQHLGKDGFIGRKWFG